jgi:glycosyltransferase involved in cell wall biosynthesis
VDSVDAGLRTNLMAHEVLWIAPNLNHYKARFLNRLAERGALRLTVLAGAEQREMGHRNLEETSCFRSVHLPVTKDRFAFSPKVYAAVVRMIRQKRYDVVLMPAEKKYILLIIFLRCLRSLAGYRLVSYNHPIIKSKHTGIRARDFVASRAIFTLYDRVVFYTAQSRQHALAHHLLPARKADYANNTLDTTTIWEHYEPKPVPLCRPCMLFIGRLIESKRPGNLARYYERLKRDVPQLRLVIVGDGPLATVVREMAKRDTEIRWMGAVTDERAIASIMKDVHLVFIPGLSGLSIVHAFAYGKPYVTIHSPRHGPEIDYVVPGYNGLILSGDCEVDCRELASLLHDPQRYESMCRAAYETAQRVTVEQWLAQMENALSTALEN